MIHSHSHWTLINWIVRHLFQKDEGHLTKREMALITDNVELGGSPDGFRYMGEIHTQLTGAAKTIGNYGRIHPSLVPVLDDLKADREAMQNESDRIRQALALVLKDCKTNQDIRDALPNCITDLVPECQGLERTRPEAFTLANADNPRAYNQYMKLREKIEFYAASQLIY